MPRLPRPLLPTIGMAVLLTTIAQAAGPTRARPPLSRRRPRRRTRQSRAAPTWCGPAAAPAAIPWRAALRFAGGRALTTPFGTSCSPNITADSQTGIGRWTDAQFLRALREGVRPDGANYFPVFPYPSFTGVTEKDALAIKAYPFSMPPARQPNRSHDVSLPFSWRFLQDIWKLLFFERGPFRPEPNRSKAYNRGAYLVTALAHCGECHAPRNFLGGLERDRGLSGNADGPDGQAVPNITPDRAARIGGWERNDHGAPENALGAGRQRGNLEEVRPCGTIPVRSPWAGGISSRLGSSVSLPRCYWSVPVCLREPTVWKRPLRPRVRPALSRSWQVTAGDHRAEAGAELREVFRAAANKIRPRSV